MTNETNSQDEKNPNFLLTPNVNNKFKKLYHEFLHPPSKYSSSSDAKNDVVFTSQVGSRFITGTIIGSVIDYLNGPTNPKNRLCPTTTTRRPVIRKPDSAAKPNSRFDRGLRGLWAAERSARLGRFLGLYSMGSESLSYIAFVLRGRHRERWLVDDVVANVVSSGVLLYGHGLRPTAAAAAAVAFGVFTVGDAGVRVFLDRILRKFES